MFLGTLRCYERVFCSGRRVQAAAATSVSSPMLDERRTNSARPRIASARAAAAALARSSTNCVEAPSRTKLLRRSIIAGAPVERGVIGSELAVESMALTSSRRAALPAGWTLSIFAASRSYWLVLSAVDSQRSVMRRKTSDSPFQAICNLV